MIRLDLHTHSEASPDGGITPEQYAKLLRDERLDVIAITDHDRIDFALGMQKALGEEYIIVGEEITTTQGEIIGLYLSEKVEPGMSATQTVAAIKKQHGLVYIPHPFETVRKGIQRDVLAEIERDVDIIEVVNGRAVAQNYGPEAAAWARQRAHVMIAASSDAHGLKGAGQTLTRLKSRPTRATILTELDKAQLRQRKPPFISLLYPKYNRLRKFLRGDF